MTHTTLQSELSNLLVKPTAVGQVLQKLQQIFRDNHGKFKQVMIMYGRYNLATEEHRKGLVEQDQYHRKLLQLTDNLLDLIKEITEDEARAYELENGIFTKILVICKSENRKEAMKKLLSERFYKGIVYDTSGEMLALEKVNEFQLIIFDDTETDDSYFDFYNTYLQTAKPYLIYFGKRRVEDSNGKEQKAYFANSIFSLHARIQEMLTFLKYYQPADNQ